MYVVILCNRVFSLYAKVSGMISTFKCYKLTESPQQQYTNVTISLPRLDFDWLYVTVRHRWRSLYFGHKCHVLASTFTRGHIRVGLSCLHLADSQSSLSLCPL